MLKKTQDKLTNCVGFSVINRSTMKVLEFGTVIGI
jgi:hypothetical protein